MDGSAIERIGGVAASVPGSDNADAVGDTEEVVGLMIGLTSVGRGEVVRFAVVFPSKGGALEPKDCEGFAEGAKACLTSGDLGRALKPD